MFAPANSLLASRRTAIGRHDSNRSGKSKDIMRCTPQAGAGSGSESVQSCWRCAAPWCWPTPARDVTTGTSPGTSPTTGQPVRDIELTVTEGSWMSLDVSPDGRTIVFDLLGDLYSIPATGGEATLLHGGGRDAERSSNPSESGRP